MLESASWQARQFNVFVEFAAQGNQCSQAHASYALSKNSKILWFSSLHHPLQQYHDCLDSSLNHVFVSFDIDSIIGDACPGVSCPATIGLSSQDALGICYASGRHAGTRIMDLSEFNPKVEDYRTGRLVANMFYYFAMGVASRNR